MRSNFTQAHDIIREEKDMLVYVGTFTFICCNNFLTRNFSCLFRHNMTLPQTTLDTILLFVTININSYYHNILCMYLSSSKSMFNKLFDPFLKKMEF